LFRVHQDRGGENRWLPIETAPRDGQALLVLAQSSGVPVVAVRDRDGAWHDAWSGDPIPAPTHWAPMIPPLPDEG
jgi:hypothetical protein